MKLLGNNKSENNENAQHLDFAEVVLVHCNIANNIYQHHSRVLYNFFPNGSFGQLLDISPKNLLFSRTFKSEFSCIELWFTNQNSKPLEIEDKIIEDQIFAKAYEFSSFAKSMGKNIVKNISKILSSKYNQ